MMIVDADRMLRGHHLRPHVEAAARPLLRAFVQCMYAFAGRTLQPATPDDGAPCEPAASGKAVPYGPGALAEAPVARSGTVELRDAYVEEQVQRLKAAKRLIVAMQVRGHRGGGRRGGGDLMVICGAVWDGCGLHLDLGLCVCVWSLNSDL